MGAERQKAFTGKMDAAECFTKNIERPSLTPNQAAAHGIAVRPMASAAMALEMLSLTDFATLTRVWPELAAFAPDMVEQLEIDAQYAGYLDRQDADIIAFRRDEGRALPAGLDYGAVIGLSNEVRSKLEAIRPATLGQAARIEGVTAAALTLILAHVKGRKGQKCLFGPEEFRAQTDVSQETLARLKAYADMLADWNARHNLVAKSTLPDLWQRHMWDQRPAWRP